MNGPVNDTLTDAQLAEIVANARERLKGNITAARVPTMKEIDQALDALTIRAGTMAPITDDMLRAAVRAISAAGDCIQGFSTPHGPRDWGEPHYIRDVRKPYGEQELWRGNSHDEMMERCEMECLRIGLAAALAPSSPVNRPAPSEDIAWWMMRNGYATGHGDTTEDMLAELEAQAKARGSAK